MKSLYMAVLLGATLVIIFLLASILNHIRLAQLAITNFTTQYAISVEE